MVGETKRVANRSGKGISGFLLFFFMCGFLFLGFLNFAKAYGFEAQMQNASEVGAGDQIRIDFNQPVLAISLDSIHISPFVGFSYRLSDNRKSLTIIPNRGFEFEKKYTITLGGVKGLSGVVMDKREFVFYTPSAEVAPAPAVTVNSSATTEEFSSLTLSPNMYVPAESSRVKKETGIKAHLTQGRYIDVSLSQQVMTLFENGVKVNEFLVSTGKVGMPTPTGQYAVQRKETNHWSNKYKLWMPYSMNFSGPYYIHELPYWPNGYHEGESHLGRKVSHGCIRLGIGPAQYVFNWADIGTPIYIHQ